MAARITIDVRMKQFEATVQAMRQFSSRDLPELLNKRVLQVVVGAKGVKGLVQLTKKATEARIRADLQKSVTYRLPGGRAITGPLLQVLAAQWLHKRGEKITDANLTNAEQAILKARIRSRAFIAASWLWSAKKLAEKVPGTKFDRLDNAPMYSGGHAEQTARADAATPGQRIFRTRVYNTAPSHPNNEKKGTGTGAEKVARQSMNRALGNAIRDMVKYMEFEGGKALGRRIAKARIAQRNPSIAAQL